MKNGLAVGDRSPSIDGMDENGNPVRLSDFEGKKLILYFYPKDSTPGCTAQSCSLRDEWKELTKKGFAVLGVSKDSEKSHQRFISKYKLPFPLLADEDMAVIKAFGVWGKKKFMGREFMGIVRTTFIIDEQGMIEHIIDDVKTKKHAEQILELYS